ncbi:MAG: hypothetical protein EA369_05050 [Bradymonadales bacterium]|nr:MAG: hypothetical protein EA369_05050 [Bradymonadales bacterium]
MQRARQVLAEDNFVARPHYRSPSYFIEASGEKEIEKIVSELLDGLEPDIERLVFIGRSMSGIQAYLRGRALHDTTLPPVTDFPFSIGRSNQAISNEQRVGLRRHLAEHQLDPMTLRSQSGRVLLLDFVYSGSSLVSLLAEISKWADELQLNSMLSQKIAIQAYYPARLLAATHLRGIARESARELGQWVEPTELEIEEATLRLRLPRKDEIRALASQVRATAISDELYVYAGIHGPQAQASFTPDLWVSGTGPNDSFDARALTELEYLFSLGARSSSPIGALLSEP